MSIFGLFTRATTDPVCLLVPAYANPCSPDGPHMWASLIRTANDSSFAGRLHVIFNPASGPGTAIEPNYANASGTGPLQSLHKAGATIYGYVATTFGKRDLNEVTTDVSRYFDSLYPGLVDGIYADEMSNDLAHVGYHQTVRDVVRERAPNAKIIGGPGTTFTKNPTGQTVFTVTDYAAVFDMLITFENTRDEYINNYTPPTWVNDFPAGRFAHLIHSSDTWDPKLVALARKRKAGMLYVTDDLMPNPYDVLPSFWDALVRSLT